VDYERPRLVHLASGRLSPKSGAVSERLKFIFEGLAEIIAAHQPTSMAVEDVFTWKNPRSAILLAQARGAALLAGAVAGVPVYEYTPPQVKSAVCGSGRAEKSQVAFMMEKILKIEGGLPSDATDALAVAVCHTGFLNPNPAITSRLRHARARQQSFRSMTAEDLIRLGFKISGK
jgi:crossover junction endodeoxyribonuclease RuvC